MKIVKINALIGNVVLKRFKEILRNEIETLIDSGILDKVMQYVNKDDILNSVNSIYISGDYLAVSNSYEGKIIRLLHFGGPGLKATNILTTCERKLKGGLL